MTLQTPLIDCVAFVLIKGDTFLAEKRRMTKKLVPGAVAIPGGHLEVGESPETALARELAEELGVTATNVAYLCSLLHRSEGLRRLHYFVVDKWEGQITNGEAEDLLWIPLAETQALDLEVDRIAVREYLRVYTKSEEVPSLGARNGPAPRGLGA